MALPRSRAQGARSRCRGDRAREQTKHEDWVARKETPKASRAWLTNRQLVELKNLEGGKNTNARAARGQTSGTTALAQRFGDLSVSDHVGRGGGGGPPDEDKVTTARRESKENLAINRKEHPASFRD